MQNDQQPLPFNEYKTRLAGFRQYGTKYRGFIFCSMTELATDPTYYEFVCDVMSDTPADAMRDAANLFYKLATADSGAA